MKRAVRGRCVLCLAPLYSFPAFSIANEVAAAMGNSGHYTIGNQRRCWPVPSGKAVTTRTSTNSSAQDLFDLGTTLSSTGMAAVARGKLGEKSA